MWNPPPLLGSGSAKEGVLVASASSSQAAEAEEGKCAGGGKDDESVLPKLNLTVFGVADLAFENERVVGPGLGFEDELSDAHGLAAEAVVSASVG